MTITERVSHAMHVTHVTLWEGRWYDRRGKLLAFYVRTHLSSLVCLGRPLVGNSAVYSRVREQM